MMIFVVAALMWFSCSSENSVELMISVGSPFVVAFLVRVTEASGRVKSITALVVVRAVLRVIRSLFVSLGCLKRAATMVLL